MILINLSDYCIILQMHRPVTIIATIYIIGQFLLVLQYVSILTSYFVVVLQFNGDPEDSGCSCAVNQTSA